MASGEKFLFFYQKCVGELDDSNESLKGKYFRSKLYLKDSILADAKKRHYIQWLCKEKILAIGILIEVIKIEKKKTLEKDE